MQGSLYPLFSIEKKGYINFVPCVPPPVKFLVNVSPKLLDEATSNFASR